MAATDFVTEAQLDSLTTTVATAVKENTTAIGTKANTSALTDHISDVAGAHEATAIGFSSVDYTATDVAAALNEVLGIAEAAAGGGITIDDAVINTTQAWSSSKIDTEIDAHIAAVIDASPEALNTLNELAAALNDDPNFATTVSTQLGNRLRFDAAQTLTAPQKTQALTNLGLAASTVDFAAAFTAALV